MGALQVPRIAAALVGLAAAVAGVAPVRAEEPVAIVDVRAPRPADAAARAQLAAALGKRTGIAIVGGESAAALVGVRTDADGVAAEAALTEARDAFGALECGRARPAAEEAMRLLAGRAAAQLDERERLAKAWTYIALCAERDGDAPVARAAADRLRGLGGAVPADLAAKYPDIDAATDRDIVPVTIAVPAEARLTIDHVEVSGAGPHFVAAGKHVAAIAQGTKRGAVMFTVHGKPLQVEVPLVEQAGTWRDVAARVAAWQGGEPPTGGELFELMVRVDVRFAVVLDGKGVALWSRGPDATTALRADELERDARAELIGDAILQRVAAWTERAPDPDVPLLTEDDVPGGRRVDEPTRWWVYAVIGGALAAGAVTIYALETGEDRQRIELTFP